jgi:predicted aspartyl protease
MIRTTVLFENQRDIVLAEAGQMQEPPRRVEIEALVDTGAVMTLLPEDVVEKLGLAIDGSRARFLSLTIGDRQMDTDCLVGPPQCEPLVGQLVLERLDLIVDAGRQTLSPRPESPFRPSLKLK